MNEELIKISRKSIQIIIKTHAHIKKSQKCLFTNRMMLKGKYYGQHVGTKHFTLHELQNEYCLDELIFTFLL